MKDGTLVSFDPGQELDRVDLKEAFEAASAVRVFLAVPKLKMGSVNVATDGKPEKQRYVEVRHPLQDESLGGSDQDLPFRALNVRLLLSTQDPAGFEVLPIAAVSHPRHGVQ